MPKRTDEFQRIITFLYETLTGTGATVTESAMLAERDGGAAREVDILIEQAVATHQVRIAIECRRRSRQESVEWIDGLIGKYSALPVDRVIAITPAGFSDAAKQKAYANRIEVMTAQDALSVDWASQLSGTWKLLSHAFALLRIIAIDADGRVIAETELNERGENPIHKNELAEHLYPQLHRLFFASYSTRAAQAFNERVKDRWQEYCDNPPKLYFELDVQLNTPVHIESADEKYQISRIVFGIGAIFEVSSSNPTGYVVKDTLVQKFGASHMGEDVNLFMAVDEKDGLKGFKIVKPDGK